MLKRLLVVLLLGWCGPAAAAGTILVYGDSLSAAYGISQKDGWVALLDERLRSKRLDYSVVNASISGETSAGGATRIGETLERVRPNVVIVALGGNDGLRGLPLPQLRANLGTIIKAAQARKAQVLLVGIAMPPNYGPKYTREFRDVFTELARTYSTAYVPFLLEGIADKRDLFQPDNIHPTAAAQPVILDTVWTGLQPLLKR